MKKNCDFCEKFGIHCEQKVPNPSSQLEKIAYFLFIPWAYTVFIDSQLALIVEQDMESCPAKVSNATYESRAQQLRQELISQMEYAGQKWGGQ